MRKKICILLILLLTMSYYLCINTSYAGIVDDLSEMKNVGEPDKSSNSEGIPAAINSIISLLQYVGSGIAIIVVTILGIKYILASPSEKADVKKSIMPIIIGCVLLFGGVNIAKLIANFSDNAIKE